MIFCRLRLCRRPQDGNWILGLLDEQWVRCDWVWGTLELTFRVFGVVLEDPGLTMDVSLLSLRILCSTWLAFGMSLRLLGCPKGVLLEPIGFILTCFEHQKFIQSGPGWHSDDTLKSNENRCVLIGLREWQVPFKYQNYILDALAAQPRCLECC